MWQQKVTWQWICSAQRLMGRTGKCTVYLFEDWRETVYCSLCLCILLCPIKMPSCLCERIIRAIFRETISGLITRVLKMCVFSLSSDGYRGESLICSSVTLALFFFCQPLGVTRAEQSHLFWKLQVLYKYSILNQVREIQITAAAVHCTTFMLIFACVVGVNPAPSSVTFLSSLHCSVTVLQHKLSRARCAPLWMLSKCFCRGERGAQPPAAFYS